MIDCQNIDTAPAHQHCDSAQSAFLDLFQTGVAQKRAYDDEESRVSTDSELYLDSEDEDLDVDDYRTTYSTFSAFYHLQRLQEQQDNQEDENAQAGCPIRPPLLTTADDSFMAKMDRVKRWVCSVSMAPSKAAAARDYAPPSVVVTRKRRMSDVSSPEDTSVKRARTSDTPSLVPDSPLLSSNDLYSPSEYTSSSVGLVKKGGVHYP